MRDALHESSKVRVFFSMSFFFGPASWSVIQIPIFLILCFNFCFVLQTRLIYCGWKSTSSFASVIQRILNFWLTRCILSKVLSILWFYPFASPSSSSLLTWNVTSGRENHVVSRPILIDELLVERQIIGCVLSRTFDFTHSLFKKRKLSV